MTIILQTSMHSVTNLRDAFALLSQAGLEEAAFYQPDLLTGAIRCDHDFVTLCHAHQDPPAAANNGGPWTTWLVLGGRGAGKTRLGAEWVRALAQGIAPYADAPHGSIALVGETMHDVREVMIEGPSGILRAGPWSERPLWLPTRGRLEWSNGAVAQAFSAEDPEALRGPQFTAAWSDELAKWRRAEDAFNMLQFGLRLGPRPRQLITTTPRPTTLIKQIIADPRTAVTRAPTHANAAFLSPVFVSHVLERYQGTWLGRQEIDGEILENRAGVLWTRATLDACRVAAAPACGRIVVAVDPPGRAEKASSACGLVAAGLHGELVYVLADESAAGLSPAGWAGKAIALWRRLQADCLVVEENHGHDMVRAVIRAEDPNVPVTPVHAQRAKYVRAEPVSMLYEQGRVKHVGVFRELEDEMCDFTPDGLSSGRSPDRLDALVWAVAALTFGARPQPRVRML